MSRRLLIMKNGIKISIYVSGKKIWYQEGKIHRDDGPAIIDDDHKEWYRHGVLIRPPPNYRHNIINSPLPTYRP